MYSCHIWRWKESEGGVFNLSQTCILTGAVVAGGPIDVCSSPDLLRGGGRWYVGEEGSGREEHLICSRFHVSTRAVGRGDGDTFRLIWTCLYGDGVERGEKRGVAAEGRVEEGGTFNLFHACLPGVVEAGGRDIRGINHCHIHVVCIWLWLMPMGGRWWRCILSITDLYSDGSWCEGRGTEGRMGEGGFNVFWISSVSTRAAQGIQLETNN